MNSEASNKILKMVEEPGKDTTFVFITDEINKIIPTLVSRCQTINFNGIKDFDLMSTEFELLFSELLRNAFQIKKRYFIWIKNY